MRILFTGATSFTGLWFARKLVEGGHDVVAAIRRPSNAYDGLRAERLGLLAGACELVWDTPFGSPAFLDVIACRRPFDILCHHASDVTDYRNPDFDALAATAANTNGLRAVLAGLRDVRCGRIVLTGSVFEAHEGNGSDPGQAFSPYGLSKTLTAEMFAYYAAREGFSLGKFVIPNPFGPYEERRFTDYLMRCWKAGKTARIATPLYVRDNVPVTLLAAAYRDFAEKLPPSGLSRLSPSCYVETQGAFAQRFADAMGARLRIATPLECAQQTAFPEPKMRFNTDTLDGTALGWSESNFWDKTASYYAKLLELG
jgi:UDP-glucose 4-epimerase